MTELPLTRLTFGHGHVTPNPNGLKARCGGPGLCPTCSREQAMLDPRVKPGIDWSGPADPTPSMINSGRESTPALDPNVKPGVDFPAVNDTPPPSLGEQAHNPAGCRLNGMPHLGPCHDPTNDAVKNHQRIVITALRDEITALREENAAQRAELDESDQLRDRMAQLLRETAAALKGAPPPRVMHDWSDLPQVAAQRAEQASRAVQLRYERTLLGEARMLLDAISEGGNSTQLRERAAKVAQFIVDEIGHPVTDEPAVGPELRSMIDTAWSLISHAYAPEYGGTDWIRTAAGWAESYERLTGHVTMGSVQDAQPVRDSQPVRPVQPAQPVQNAQPPE